MQKEELEQVKQGEVQTEQIDHPNEESMKKPELQEKLSMHIDWEEKKIGVFPDWLQVKQWVELEQVKHRLLQGLHVAFYWKYF